MGVRDTAAHYRRRTPVEVPDYDADDAAMDTTPGCPRCFLRGPHECLPARAEAYLGRREESVGTRYTRARGANE